MENFVYEKSISITASIEIYFSKCTLRILDCIYLPPANLRQIGILQTTVKECCNLC